MPKFIDWWIIKVNGVEIARRMRKESAQEQAAAIRRVNAKRGRKQSVRVVPFSYDGRKR